MSGIRSGGGDYAGRAANLSDLASASAARSNLGLAPHSAAAAPGLTDDSSAGYVAGVSRWLNTSTTPNTLYECVSAALGAAVWVALGASAAVLTAGFLEDVTVYPLSSSPAAVESPNWS